MLSNKLDYYKESLKNPENLYFSREITEYLIEVIEEALKTISFYADPDTYHATTLLADRPCGDIIEDYSSDLYTDVNYKRPMLGKTAREFCIKYLVEK